MYYVSIEDTFDVIQRTPITTGHGGRDRMLKHVGKNYANITRESVDLFKSFCVRCQEKIKRPKTTGVVVRPILSQDFSSRCQVDLIDMQSSTQGQYRWIMVYQCHLSKDMLAAWLSDNNTQEWSLGLRFVQNQKNNAYHAGIKCTPYSAMFG